MDKPEKIELFAKYLSDEFNSLKLDDEYYLWELRIMYDVQVDGWDEEQWGS